MGVLSSSFGLDLFSHADNGFYRSCITTGSKEQLRREINHPQNWVRSNSVVWPSSFPTFTVTSSPEPWPGTLLADGCISFIAYQMDDPDRIAFILLEDVVAGTRIRFTDQGWSGGRFYAVPAEEGCIWTADSALSAGTVVEINHGSINGLFVSHGSLCGNLNALNNTSGETGDQVIAYQGNVNAPVFLTGLSSREWSSTAQGASNEDRSLIPNTLSQGASALGFSSHQDNGYYSGAVVSGTSSQLATAFSNSSNWTRSNNVNWPGNLPSIIVTQSSGCCVVATPAFSFTTNCLDTSVAFVNTTSAADANTSFAWDIDGDGITDYTNNGNFTHTYPGPGTYMVKLKTSRGGCTDSSTQTVVVGVAPAQPSITPSGSLTLCDGESVTLSASPGFPIYTWSNGATTQSINVNQAGTYTLTVTNVDGCESPANSATVVVGTTLPTPLITTTGPTSFCDGDSVELFAPAGLPGYLWSTGDTTQSIVVKDAGSFFVYAISTQGCQSDSAVINVNVTPTPLAPTIIASGPVEFCEGGSVQLLANAAVNNYTWSNGSSTSSITVSTSGTYSVFVTSSAGCLSESVDTTIVVYPNPTKPFLNILGSDSICEGDSVTIFGPAGADTYQWSTNDTTPSIVVGSSGTYSLTVVSAFGCSSPPADTLINVLPTPPSPTINQNGNILSSLDPADSYAWFLNGTPVGPDSSSIDAALYGSGLYTLQLSNGPCVSPLSEAQDITVTQLSSLAGVSAWKAHPNPASAQVSIAGEFPGSISLHWLLVNSLGQLVLSGESESQIGAYAFTLSVSDLPSGVYHLRLVSDTQISNLPIWVAH